MHRTRHWRGNASPSGEGASDAQTAELRAALPALLRELGTRTLLDLPCGDFRWMQQVNLPVARYVGADLLSGLIAGHRARFGDGRRRFLVLDLTVDELREADVLLCRDCLARASLPVTGDR